jgi:hypothetical protein
LEGNHTFSFSAIDNAGHQITHSTNIKIDKFQPIVNITSPTVPYVGNIVSVNWNASDTVDSNLNGSLSLFLLEENESMVVATGLNNTGMYSWNTALFADGTYRLYLLAADDAGNEGGSMSQSFVVDNSAPTVIIDQPRGGEVLGGDYKILNIFWDASDSNDANLDGTIWIAYSPDSGVTWINLREGVLNSGKDTYDVSGWENGDYILRINATDDAGNTGYATSDTFTIDKTDPLVSITRPDPGYLYINLFDRDIIPPIPISFILLLPNEISTVVVGKTTITVSASDDFSDISSIEIHAGGITKVFYQTPYQFEWNPPTGVTGKDGKCSIMALAEDLAGNTATDEINGILTINF